MTKITNHKKTSHGWKLENTYISLPKPFYTIIKPTPAKAPSMIIFNHALSKFLGLSFEDTKDEDLAQIFSGNILPEGATPFSQAYAGHQFGHFTILGDGRAHILGEQITPAGERYDIQLKGSGQTPYSRRGDGRAALAPMLREYIISEAMHALGVPTTRSLAVVTTGEPVFRDTVLPGAILTRVAKSHIRIGTFEFAAAYQGFDGIKLLADYAIARHYPELKNHEQPYLAFLDAVIEKQAKLVALWMQIGFVHGVMNTDNISISGETIDYGPCAFVDRFAIDKVFSSIDHHGRYAFGNQARIAQWNLARLAEAILPLLHEDIKQARDLAEASLENYSEIFNVSWLNLMRKKLGLFGEKADDLALVQDLLEFMQQTNADYTGTFRNLIAETMPIGEAYQSQAFQQWYLRWQERLKYNSKPLQSSFCLMRASNPAIIPLNQHVEDALNEAEEGDLKLFNLLLEALQNPFEENETNRSLRKLPAHAKDDHKTFCGT